MAANSQYQLTPADLDAVLALVRGGTLAEAGRRLGVDASTVFRVLQRVEKGLGRRLFERSRAGYLATELAQQFAQHAERIEAELEAARGHAAGSAGTLSGLVRISTTDTVLHALLLPALSDFGRAHPGLRFELAATNELASLSRRDADIAVRATRQPPPHLIGRRLGPLRVAVFAARGLAEQVAPLPAQQDGAAAAPGWDAAALSALPWIGPDEALPEHPSVRWRRKHLPRVVPQYGVNSIGSLAEAVAAGLGAGVISLAIAARSPHLVALTPALEPCETDLWLLTHPESRHLRRIAAVVTHLAARIAVPE
ncbi:LysR family transcriptional regulator [Cupriavidus sp. USMAA2-4]|uniref:LysR family transcriptional regulator n=1 Tax=Cupriavidus malaysiensis TaxID=367825 RepID=A0ABM6F0L1_9BURK|nr:MULTISPECIES: LysR family transcriptional regulator [Cupriavidus]AOY92119.1 LysR family transcriptional regulator [Cupriavidus sp. USMAA2-4]AOY98323.1 LysR family transcriptional regulator [Cupriavidus sp. USMAHM13]AOZ04754.1 LysR family transcriptional regulator [Cupriavidus malaysiensis]